MKKIKNMQQLKAEKKMLVKRRAELEKAIHYDWLDVKKSLQPKHLAGNMLSSITNKEQLSSDSFLSSLAARAAGNAVKKAEEKLMKWLKKK